ncbi:Gfo/Idh/MocA family protein [Halomontanus rarus]|uniref:Gfo/Idh/MocA family protein n=1 Tax=Halomontanus rarus TaxID=3034020 RepID=UPI0023E8F664|nr:Gfo/Idh/MocA family oxidoreductase [Halovivax sp. TS33]
MTTQSVAFVGTGKLDGEDATGFAMAYKHADAYETINHCSLDSCADIVRENAEEFAATYDIPSERVYEDYEQMLQEIQPDIVSVTVPPAIHAEIVLGCIRSGVVDAVHCEKPMADDWNSCVELVDAANDADVQLTFNHQRRFGQPFREAKRLLERGDIGELTRVEFAAANLFDYGTHSFDLCNYYNDECDIEWVMSQIDYSKENIVFGAHNTNEAIVQWKYENGVFGYGATGVGTAAEAINCHHRLIGTDGCIEIGVGFCGSGDGPTLRINRSGAESWETIETGDVNVHGPGFQQAAIEHVVTALVDGVEPELSGRNALRSTELIFGAWESARRRGRVDFPLNITDNPLESMLESGELNPKPSDD